MMLWTIIIVGVKEFLRVDEVLDLTVEQFLQNYFVITAENVQGLALYVQGKTDEDRANLAMWDDSECPDLSPTRAVLIWLAASGIKSGKLFPTAEELHAKATAPLESLSYDNFLEEIKFLCEAVLKKDMKSESMKRLILGTHMLRKTAYLLAFWGFNRKYGHDNFSEADKSNILQSARHKDPRSCTTYLGDCGTLKALLSKHKVNKDDPRHRVSEWEPIHITTLDAFEALNIPSKKYSKSIVALAEWYMYEKLDIPNDGQFGRLTFYQIHEKACAFVPDLSCEQEYHKVLQHHIPAAILPSVLDLINKSQQARVMEAVQHLLEVQQVHFPAAATPPMLLQ
jgi:hypothetical protein